MNPRLLVFWICCGLLWLTQGAQLGFSAVSIQSTIRSYQWVLGDQNLIQVQLENADRSATIELPKVPGLSLQQAGPPAQSSQTSWINGTKTSHNSLTFQISVTAEHEGRFTIPPIVARYQGQSFQTESYPVQVTKAQESDALSLRVSTSKKKIYQGERLDLTLVWQLHQSVGDYRFQFPLLAQKDELKLRIKPDSNKNKSLKNLSVNGFTVAFVESPLGNGGVQYAVTFEITPPNSGELKIPAAQIKAMVVTGYQDQRDFFGRVVQRPQTEAAYSRSKSLSIPVLPLPSEGQPDDFSGAVGQFRYRMEAKGRRFEVGEPVPLTLTLTGRGELEKIDRPSLSDLTPNFEVEETLAPGEVKDGQLVFTQIIRPTHSGTQTLGPLSFSYFDPDTGSYQRAEAQGIDIEVTEAQTLQLSEIEGAPAPTQKAPEVVTTQGTHLLSSQPQEETLPSWVWLAGLVLITAGFGAWQNKKPAAPKTTTNRPPFTAQDIQQTEALEPAAGCNEVLRLTTELLDWKFGPQRRWTGAELQKMVAQEALSAPVAAQISQLIKETETRLYAGGVGADEPLAPLITGLLSVYQELTNPASLAASA